MLSDFGTEVPGELCMSKHLSMANIQSIETLHRVAHSNWEIARILGIDRGAVNKYEQQLRAAEAPPSLPDPATVDSQKPADSAHRVWSEKTDQRKMKCAPAS